MRKPAESSGIDDFTAKCQLLNRSLYILEEGDTFGDSEGDEIGRGKSESNDDSSDEESNAVHTPILSSETNKTSHLGLSDSSESIVKALRIALDGNPPSDTKSKNSKPNPTRLNIGKCIILFYNMDSLF